MKISEAKIRQQGVGKTTARLTDSLHSFAIFSPPSVGQLDQFTLLENMMSSTAGGSCFDPSSSSLYYSQAALSGLGGSHGSLQDPVHMRSNMLYSNCSGGLPNIILTGESCGSFRVWLQQTNKHMDKENTDSNS